MSMDKARLESQLGNGPCDMEDSEEMFWLRQSDDYQSKVKLGGLLVGQYRFREAVDAYREAACIKNDDPMLFLRLGGACLTIRRFQEAFDAYQRYIALCGMDKKVSYPLGIWHFLRNDYTAATECLLRCVPCDDEMAIAVIYWHCIASFRSNQSPVLLEQYHDGMNVGHHGAYRLAVSLFAGAISLESALTEFEPLKNDLDFCVATYGIACFLADHGDFDKRQELMQAVLDRSSVWPCISYLAAWNDVHGEGNAQNEGGECDG